jgi:hypothetical protein
LMISSCWRTWASLQCLSFVDTNGNITDNVDS